jgi:hypothetical protein
MDKILSYGALGVAGLMGLAFLLDLVAGFPFGQGPFLIFDILGLLAAGIVGYLGFNALREIK